MTGRTTGAAGAEPTNGRGQVSAPDQVERETEIQETGEDPMFKFDNFAMTVVIVLIVISWLSFFSVILSG
jgi:hypothetical protein